MEIIWDGGTSGNVLPEEFTEIRNKFSDATKRYDWSAVIELLRCHPSLINAVRLGGSSLYTALHQAAHGGASVEIARQLIGMGGWRTIQNFRGERPIDIAERKGHHFLIEILTPELKRSVPNGILLKIQSYFHDVIRERIEREMLNHKLRLPELEPLLELDDPHIWFPVPGMYGGFSFRLELTGVDAKLISESWSRVVAGSGQRHEITSSGAILVEEGFV